MTDTLIFGGKTLTSSKKAAEMSGYAQDYIGQLARKGLITAERVGNLWYVSMESLTAYKNNAESFTPQQPQVVSKEADSYISFDGKDYISASRGAKMTGYNPDYIGQLARAGKILSRQVGNRWYVERESLVTHKREKDALLAAVQSEAVGIVRPGAAEEATGPRNEASPDTQHFRYFRDDKELLPTMRVMPKGRSDVHTIDLRSKAATPIRIRKNADLQSVPPAVSAVRIGRKSIFSATGVPMALTIVLLISVGIVTLKDSSVLVMKGTDSPILNSMRQSAAAERAAEALESLGAILEAWIVPEITYKRR